MVIFILLIGKKKPKKTTINPINNEDNKYFQSTLIVALNHEEIKKDLQRITKIKPFWNKYNCEGINISSEKDEWKKFEKNNAAIALAVMDAKKEKLFPDYVSKPNSNHKKKLFF